jgi:hypothetical protein
MRARAAWLGDVGGCPLDDDDVAWALAEATGGLPDAVLPAGGSLGVPFQGSDVVVHSAVAFERLYAIAKVWAVAH